MTPFLADADFTLYQGDARQVLAGLEPDSVHCVVTSPPYWGLRDYGTGSWEGGDTDCDHSVGGQVQQTKAGTDPNTVGVRPGSDTSRCRKCGATRTDNQLGLEATPDLYIESMVQVFREVRRVLRADGTCWVNMGDSYAGSWGAQSRGNTTGEAKARLEGTSPLSARQIEAHPLGLTEAGSLKRTPGLKAKDLCMIPARLALALQADGWWLRSQIIWSKPNPMPESVTDRPTTSHEYIFLLSKSPRYFFDQEAVREPNVSPEQAEHTARYAKVYDAHTERVQNGEGVQPGNVNNVGIHSRGGNTVGRNVRSVWEIPTQPYAEAHFATFPEELVRRCILAGTSERGCCPECGAPWVREVERIGIDVPRGNEPHLRRDPGNSLDRDIPTHYKPTITTLGWKPNCPPGCLARGETAEGDGLKRKYQAAVPCTVLDPFMGSGTTALVARKHGRRSVGVELNPSYCELAARRLAQLSLLAEAGP